MARVRYLRAYKATLTTTSSIPNNIDTYSTANSDLKLTKVNTKPYYFLISALLVHHALTEVIGAV